MKVTRIGLLETELQHLGRRVQMISAGLRVQARRRREGSLSRRKSLLVLHVRVRGAELLSSRQVHMQFGIAGLVVLSLEFDAVAGGA